MKLYFAIFLFFAVNLFASCGGKNSTPPPVPSISPAGYTGQDATTAIDSFLAAFYSNEDKLYYTTTARTQIAEGWTQAVYWDMVMNAYKRTLKNGDEVLSAKYRQLIDDIYTGGYNAYEHFDWDKAAYGWGNSKGFIYDDIMWWVISLARAYEITQNQDYLNYSKSSFDWVWREAYDPVEGGMFWTWKPSKLGKNACINYPTVIGAMTLYKITGEQVYFDKGKEIYDWAQQRLFRASDGCVADGPNNFEETYTNNQAMCIGASMMMYVATQDEQYLNNAILAANYTWNKNQASTRMCDVNGILPAEASWNEQGVMKSIFAQYIIRLIEDGNQPQYIDWMRDNINKGWQNRDRQRGITFRDYNVTCPAGEIQSAEASSIPALMQVIPPVEQK